MIRKLLGFFSHREKTTPIFTINLPGSKHVAVNVHKVTMIYLSLEDKKIVILTDNGQTNNIEFLDEQDVIKIGPRLVEHWRYHARA